MKKLLFVYLALSLNIFAEENIFSSAERSVSLILNQNYAQMSNEQKLEIQKNVISITHRYNPEEARDIFQKFDSLNSLLDSSKVFYEQNDCKKFLSGYVRVSLQKQDLRIKLTCKNISNNSLKVFKQLQISANELYGSLLADMEKQSGSSSVLTDLTIQLEKLSKLEELIKNNQFIEIQKLLKEFKNLLEE